MKQEAKDRISRGILKRHANDPELRKRISETNKKIVTELWKNKEYRESHLKGLRSESYRKQRSITTKKMWARRKADPEALMRFTERHLKSLRTPQYKEKLSNGQKASWNNKNRKKREILFPWSDTLIEQKYESILIKKGIKFEKQKHLLWGTKFRTIPDFFIEPNICIYVDGCYWHGCPIHYKGSTQPGTLRNMANDKVKRGRLKELGYNVIRIWEHEINEMDED